MQALIPSDRRKIHDQVAPSSLSHSSIGPQFALAMAGLALAIGRGGDGLDYSLVIAALGARHDLRRRAGGGKIQRKDAKHAKE